MGRIALRYGNTALSGLEYNSTAENQIVFNPVWVSNPIPTTNGVKGRLLNGRGYSHIYYSFNKIDVIISADEIDSAVFQFLKMFWVSPFKYISIVSDSEPDVVGGVSTYSNYIEVFTEHGDMPIEYIDELIDLPEIKLSFEYSGVI